MRDIGIFVRHELLDRASELSGGWVARTLTQTLHRYRPRTGFVVRAGTLARGLLGRRGALLREQALKQARGLRQAGDLAAALAVYDGLPHELREHADVAQARKDILERLCKRAEKEARRLRRTGDLIGALAVYEALPLELRESAEIRGGRGDVLELLAKQAQKEARRLREAGDLCAALAVCDRLPTELREGADILQERARLLHWFGRLDDARDAFRKVLATDPARQDSWHSLVTILRDLDRTDQLRAAIREMVVALSATFENLVQAARMARKGRLFQLADELIDRAMLARATASPEAIMTAAQDLLSHGEQGRVINLLNCEPVHADATVRGLALDLSGAALAQLRRAGRSGISRPVGETERADVVAALSILAQRDAAPAAPDEAAWRGIAIVSSSLGAGGSQKQAVELVRQLCNSPVATARPVFLFVLARSGEQQEFFHSGLAGLDLTVEFLSDFELAAKQELPPELAGKLNLLPPKVFAQAAGLIHRLRLHRPEAVLAMSDIHGVSVMLAASIVGVPRIVVSARTLPPPACRRPDSFLKPVYQAAIARNTISLVTNAAATAQAFADWLGCPSDRIGTIYNGIDVERLLSQRDCAATTAHRRVLGIPDGARIVGSVFQARTQKRPRLWIEAAAAIARRAPDVAFVVVGDKLLFDDVSATLARYGLEDRFHRPGVRNDVASWLDLMNVFLLTSESEGTPNALLEAQALGRPVVATDVGGNAETFIPGVTGVLLSANPTPDQIADGVLRVLDDPGFAARARGQGPAFIRQRFDPRRMAAEYLDLCFAGDAPDRKEIDVPATSREPTRSLSEHGRAAR